MKVGLLRIKEVFRVYTKSEEILQKHSDFGGFLEFVVEID